MVGQPLPSLLPDGSHVLLSPKLLSGEGKAGQSGREERGRAGTRSQNDRNDGAAVATTAVRHRRVHKELDRGSHTLELAGGLARVGRVCVAEESP